MNEAATLFGRPQVVFKEIGTFSITQTKMTGRLTIQTFDAGLNRQCALMQYSEAHCGPDICETVQLIATRKVEVPKLQHILLKRTIYHPIKLPRMDRNLQNLIPHQ